MGSRDEKSPDGGYIKKNTNTEHVHTNGIWFRKSMNVVGEWKGIAGKVARICPI